jgi:hypothetical protein
MPAWTAKREAKSRRNHQAKRPARATKTSPVRAGPRRSRRRRCSACLAVRFRVTFAGASAEAEEAANIAANAGEGLRHVVDRLEARTVEATELRVRLEITERAESTVRAELAEERRRREEAEREREDLRRELQALQEARESPEGPGPSDEIPSPASGGARGGTQAPEAGGERRSLWSRIFGSR